MSYGIAGCWKLDTIGEKLISPAAIEIVKTMFEDKCAKKLLILQWNAIARRIGDIA